MSQDMPEYVYALFDFVPENPDEISFKAGDRIEVIEKDDVYSDGWWQGRTATSGVGLFPQSFTSPSPPETTSTPPAIEVHESEPVPLSPTILQTLREVPETSPIGSPDPDPLNPATPRTMDGEVMHATMTDVQKAIEQLGRHDADGTRSFSFASSRGDGDGDWTDRDSATDTDGEVDGWHLNARQRLAENSRIINEGSAGPSTPMRVSAPPIEVELSDESEAEDDESPRITPQPHVLEEGGGSQVSVKPRPSNFSLDLDSCTPVMASDAYLVPSPGTVVDDLPTATVHGKSFIEEQERGPRASSPEPIPKHTTEPEPQPEQVPPTRIPLPSSPAPMNGVPLSPLPSTPPPAAPLIPASPITPTSILPERSRTPIFQQPSTPSSSTITSIGIQQALGSPTKPQSPFRPQAFPPDKPPLPPASNATPPAEWSVEEVVGWLKAKGIDQGTRDKFTEQDITGDVLLELDLDLLKTEIGIVAFGKRKRIANAITELKMSVEPESGAHSESFFSHTRSPSSAQGSSFNGISLLSSVPPVSTTGPPTPGGFYFSGSPDANSLSPDTPRSTRPRRESDTGSQENVEALNRTSSRNSFIGLGIQLTSKFQKSRPSQLNLSPSDGNLGGKNAVSLDNVVTLDDDRTAMSEGEIPNTGSSRNSNRRKQSGRLFESNGPETGESGKDTVSTPASLSSTKRNSIEDQVPLPKNNRRTKRSLDNPRPSDRLSLFGTAFSSSLGKPRKPPPRYSAGSTDREDDGASGKGEKGTSPSTFSRLYHIGERKYSISKHTAGELTARQTALDKAKSITDASSRLTKEEKDRVLLRKRNSGGETPKSPVFVPPSGGPGLVQGRSVLEQIGTPDFNGWLMKKGEHYHTWKNRYCVLKGHNLYWMRSNGATETKIKGYINTFGYKITPDESIKPGNYGFRMDHPDDKTHMFYSDTQSVVREWMKALMKSTIERDYSKPVSSTATVPTIPLDVAQAMNPPPRPPSPGSRAATQRAMRRPNPDQLSSRDAQVLLLGAEKVKGEAKQNGGRVESFFPEEHIPSPIDILGANSQDAASTTPKPNKPTAPPRPSRDRVPETDFGPEITVEDGLIDWANAHLPPKLQFTDISSCGGLNLMRIAESIKGTPASPPVLDTAFPSGPTDDKLDGLFSLFDFLMNSGVHLGVLTVSDIRQGKKDKVVQLLKALKSWEDKRMEISQFLSNDPDLVFGPKSYLSTTGGLVWTPVV